MGNKQLQLQQYQVDNIGRSKKIMGPKTIMVKWVPITFGSPKILVEEII